MSKFLTKQTAPPVAMETERILGTASRCGSGPNAPHRSVGAANITTTMGHALPTLDRPTLGRTTGTKDTDVVGPPPPLAVPPTYAGRQNASTLEKAHVGPPCATATTVGGDQPQFNFLNCNTTWLPGLCVLLPVVAAAFVLNADGLAWSSWVQELRPVGVFLPVLAAASCILKWAQCCRSCADNEGPHECGAARWHLFLVPAMHLSVGTTVAKVKPFPGRGVFDACAAAGRY